MLQIILNFLGIEADLTLVDWSACIPVIVAVAVVFGFYFCMLLFNFLHSMIKGV